jgi:predicted DNA-binding transcriptional regulator YafY
MGSPHFEEKVKTSRILAIDSLIRSGSYPNAASMAKKMEVSTRTILRDIDYLRLFYEAPLEYDALHRGYYYTEPNFFIKSVMLTEGELFSIALFDQLLEQYRNTPLEGHLRNIFRKILETMPQEITVDSSILNDNVSFIPDNAGSINIAVFEDVFTALRSRKTINFEYRQLDKTAWTKRTVDPYHAICQRGNWYVIGNCHDKKIPRLFNFTRIRKTEITKKSFTVPSDFNPYQYFDKEMGVWASARKMFTIEFLVDKEIGTFALNHKWHKTQEVIENLDGSVKVKFTTNQMPEVLRWILGQGHTVKVLRPPELVKAIKDETAKMIKMYKS